MGTQTQLQAKTTNINLHFSLKVTREGTESTTNSPAKYQASPRSLHERGEQAGPYTRRPSTSTPSISEPTSRRSSEGKSEDEKTGRTSQDGTLHVIGQEEGSLRT